MDGMSPLWKAVLCLTLFAAWRAQVEFRAMTSPSRHPLDCAQRCPCPPRPLPPCGDATTRPHACHGEALHSRWRLCVCGGNVDAGGKASCLPLAREIGVRAAGRGANFIVSPLSIHEVLALVAAGTWGETRGELLGFLGSASLDELHGAPATELASKLNGLAQTSFARGVWVDRMQVLEPEFMATAASSYAAIAENVDFFQDAEQARRRVNAFVEGATNKLGRQVHSRHLRQCALLQGGVVSAIRPVGDLHRAVPCPGRHHRALHDDRPVRVQVADRRLPGFQGPQAALLQRRRPRRRILHASPSPRRWRQSLRAQQKIRWTDRTAGVQKT